MALEGTRHAPQGAGVAGARLEGVQGKLTGLKSGFSAAGGGASVLIHHWRFAKPKRGVISIKRGVTTQIVSKSVVSYDMIWQRRARMGAEECSWHFRKGREEEMATAKWSQI